MTTKIQFWWLALPCLRFPQLLCFRYYARYFFTGSYRILITTLKGRYLFSSLIRYLFIDFFLWNIFVVTLVKYVVTYCFIWSVILVNPISKPFYFFWHAIPNQVIYEVLLTSSLSGDFSEVPETSQKIFALYVKKDITWISLISHVKLYRGDCQISHAKTSLDYIFVIFLLVVGEKIKMVELRGHGVHLPQWTHQKYVYRLNNSHGKLTRNWKKGCITTAVRKINR